MLLFQCKTVQLAESRTYQTLYSSAKEQAATLREVFDGRFTILDALAASLASQTNDFTQEDITARMNAIVAASDFENLAIAGRDGVAHTNDGQTDDFI